MATTQEVEAKLKGRIKELEKMDQGDLVAMAKKMGLNTKSTSKKRLASLVARKELREGARAQRGQISAKEAFERILVEERKHLRILGDRAEAIGH